MGVSVNPRVLPPLGSIMNPLDVKRFSAAGFLAALFWTVLSGPVGAVVPGSSGAAPDGFRTRP